VPNVRKRGTPDVEVGEYYAIEPFATSGIGKVIDSDFVYIFANTGLDKPLEGTTEKLRKYLREKYGPLPYASRWVGTASKDIDVVAEIRELVNEKVIRGFPMQIEKKARPISQAEHTIFITEDGPVILTERS
jgi:methionyl aminopeptidase